MEDLAQSLRQAFDDYMTVYFSERDIEKTLARLAPNLTGIGTGVDEFDLREMDGFPDLYVRDIGQAPQPIHYTYHASVIDMLASDFGLVVVLFDISSEIDGQPFSLPNLRMSLLFQKIDGRWLIRHKHISLPAQEHEEGEAYPIKELQERNRILESMVTAKTAELAEQNRQLEKSLAEIKKLSGMLPICSGCKKIRDDSGYWEDVSIYIQEHSDVEFTHGLCPDCLKVHFPNLPVD